MSEKLVIAKDVVKIYKSGTREVRAVDGLSFDVEEGELAVVLGPSGAGKTTILNLMGGMDSVTEGDLIVDGNNLRGLTARALTEYRRTEVGFVFQFYNLMPNLTAIENVELATELSKNAFPPMEILEKVGLKDRAFNFPAQLSGGEQQRLQGRLRRIPSFYCATSLREHWITRRAKRYCSFFTICVNPSIRR